MATFSLRRVTGAGFDGSTVTTTLGKIEIPIIKADYGDALETAFLSYMGGQENDEQSPGSYKTNNLKLTVSAMVLRVDILPNFPVNGFGLTELPIVISRSHPEAGADSDMLLRCRCTNLAAAVENSNKVEESTLEFTVGQVKWTRNRMTINKVRKAGGLASVSKF
jgi:hypothetical protein